MSLEQLVNNNITNKLMNLKYVLPLQINSSQTQNDSQSSEGVSCKVINVSE